MNKIISHLLNLSNFLKTSGLESENQKIAFQISDFESDTFKEPEGTIDPQPKSPIVYPTKPWPERFQKALKENNYIIEQAESYMDDLFNLKEINHRELEHVVQRFFHYNKNFQRWRIDPNSLLQPSEIKDIFEYFKNKKLEELQKANIRPDKKDYIRAHIKDLWRIPADIYKTMFEGKYLETV